MLAECEGEDLLLACSPVDFITGFIAYKAQTARRGASIPRPPSIERGCRSHAACDTLALRQRAHHVRCALGALCAQEN